MEMRAVVVDDEPLARQALRSMLDAEDGILWVGEARNGHEAVEVLDRGKPDVVFLDIEMPGASGLQVLGRIEVAPLVVFTTAYDRYALEAFDVDAVDFLLKPFGKHRFRQSMAKVRRIWSGGNDGRWLRRVMVTENGKAIPLAVETIESIQGADDYVRIRHGGHDHLVSRRLGSLEELLNPERFVRIHRSWIINLDFVKSFSLRAPGGRIGVRMTDGTEIQASRRRSPTLRQHLAQFGQHRGGG